MDGDRRNQVVAFSTWQAREADYPLPEDWWITEQRAMLRDRMHRRILWALVVFLCAWCWGLLWLRGRF